MAVGVFFSAHSKHRYCRPVNTISSTVAFFLQQSQVSFITRAPYRMADSILYGLPSSMPRRSAFSRDWKAPANSYEPEGSWTSNAKNSGFMLGTPVCLSSPYSTKYSRILSGIMRVRWRGVLLRRAPALSEVPDAIWLLTILNDRVQSRIKCGKMVGRIGPAGFIHQR